MSRGGIALLLALSIGGPVAPWAASTARAQDPAVPDDEPASEDESPREADVAPDAAPVIETAPGPPGRAGAPLFGPYANRRGQWDPSRDAIVAAAGAPPERRTGRIDARRLFAERRARDAALAALHRFADDAMAAARVLPAVANAVHRAIDRRANVRTIRRLSDGGAVVELEVSGRALRRASGERGSLPWQR